MELRYCKDIRERESKTLIDLPYACGCLQRVLSSGRPDLGGTQAARPEWRKTVLMLHDDLQHRSQTCGAITVAECRSVIAGNRRAMREPVFTNQAPFSLSRELPDFQVGNVDPRNIFNLDQVALRRTKQVLPVQDYRAFQNAGHLN